ncbi:MAG: NapC/NirT family cytochrome c [Proteobacteria bacterium]|nr:NapC/NirT family cytochrome c [Pseudomonadota bacterium]
MSDQPSPSRTWSARHPWLRAMLRPSVYLPMALLTFGGFIAGATFWVSFDTMLSATSTDAFCTGCHSMRSTVLPELLATRHGRNPMGVAASCADCHIPHAFSAKLVRKIEAAREVWAELTFKVSTPEKFERHRWAMAEREWARLKADNAAPCRTCHNVASMDLDTQPPAAAAMHRMRAATGQATCIDCHKGVAHKMPTPPGG